MTTKTWFWAATMAALCLLRAGAQTANYTPTKENLQARETFRSDRFGILLTPEVRYVE